MSATFIVDSEHESSSLAVQERADILGHGVRKVSIKVSSAEFKLSTTRL